MKTTDSHAAVQLKNILFATNFSPGASAALRYAVALTKRYDAKLYLLEVRPGGRLGPHAPRTMARNGRSSQDRG
jgi:nucleotide-binding universal stress UspA family protein